MEANTKSATKRHQLTTAGLVTAAIGVVLIIIGIVGISTGGSWLVLSIALALLVIPVGVILMIAGWMIRMRQAAEQR